MYVVCSYDVTEKKCVKVMKILRKYLFHVQNSVFEGTLTPKQFKRLQDEIDAVITEEDSVIYYFSFNEKQLYKEIKGKKGNTSNILI